MIGAVSAVLPRLWLCVLAVPTPAVSSGAQRLSESGGHRGGRPSATPTLPTGGTKRDRGRPEPTPIVRTGSQKVWGRRDGGIDGPCSSRFRSPMVATDMIRTANRAPSSRLNSWFVFPQTGRIWQWFEPLATLDVRENPEARAW